MVPMDAFLSANEKTLRARVRECFEERRRAGRPEEGFPDELIEETLITEGESTLLGPVLVLEETSSHSPRLGRVLSRRMGPALGGRPGGRVAAAAAESIGSSVFVLEACTRAARDKGMFSSVLMEAGRVQQDMADFTLSLESLRFEIYRSLLLLERGETGQGGAELERAAERAAALREGILRLASGLLGEEWLRDHFPVGPPGAEPASGPATCGRTPGETTETKERSDP